MGYLILMASLVVVALALAEFSILTSRFSNLGAGLILAIFLWEAFTISMPKIKLGMVSTYPQDLVFVVLAIAGIVRFFMRKKFSSVHLIWFSFGLIMLASFIRGVMSYGFQAAGVETREFFYFFAAGLYFMNFPKGSHYLKRLTQIWLSVAGILVLLALFRWASGGFGLAAAQQLMDTEYGGMRVLNAAQAFFLAQAFLISLFLRFIPESSRLLRNLAIVLLPVLVLLQHRTVWVVVFVSVLLVAFGGGKQRSRVLSIVTVAAIAGVILGLSVTGGSSENITHSLNASTAEAISTQHSTFMWRLEGWQELIAQSEKFGLSDFLFGKPFGAGYTREVWGSKVNYTPHNFYIQVFLRLGILGLIILLYIYAVLLRGIMRFSERGIGNYFSNRLMYILLITQLIYFITYSPHYEQGIILGLAVALATKLSEDQHVVQTGEAQWTRQSA